MAYSVFLRDVASDAVRSQRTVGILGISVVAALAGETLEQAWSRSPVTSERSVVWRSTAGVLRDAGSRCWPPAATCATSPWCSNGSRKTC